MTNDFRPLHIDSDLFLDLSDNEYPTQVRGWDKREPVLLPDGATHYGIVTEGDVRVAHGDWQGHLSAGMFFVLPGAATLTELKGRGLVISRVGYLGLRLIGGPPEPIGRLRYIDGCSDTLLAAPPLLGDPCLNHLHLPPGVDQSRHTHPSERIGVILKGSGECHTPSGVFPLTAGMGWHIPTGCLHSFFTAKSSLDVLAWHPDSDFGPTHEAHPMINRTFLETQPLDR